MPSLDLAIYKMGGMGNTIRHSPMFPSPNPSHVRDDWKPIQGTRFIEGSRGRGCGIRRVFEMVYAAGVPKRSAPKVTVTREAGEADFVAPK